MYCRLFLESMKESIQEKLEELIDTLEESPAQRQAAMLSKYQESPNDYVPPVIPVPEPLSLPTTNQKPVKGKKMLL